jgi:type IV fimbrial biogenesis protein FimT
MLTPVQRAGQRGFTLIEMMIAVAVLAVILSLGVPSFQTFMAHTRLRTTAEAILNGVQLARAEAVRRNTEVRFDLASDLGWSVVAAGTTLQARSAAEGSKGITLDVRPTAASAVTFNGMGRVAANNPAGASLTRIVVSGGTKSRRIDIATGGLIRICDPEVSAVGDPRKCED